MKVATSFISFDQAKHNLELEIADDDTFDTIYDRALKTWDDKLDVIEVEGGHLIKKYHYILICIECLCIQTY